MIFLLIIQTRMGSYGYPAVREKSVNMRQANIRISHLLERRKI